MHDDKRPGVGSAGGGGGGKERDKYKSLARRLKELIRASVREAIAGLPDSQREVVRLHKLEGLSMKEISERLDVRGRVEPIERAGVLDAHRQERQHGLGELDAGVIVHVVRNLVRESLAGAAARAAPVPASRTG